MNSIVLLIAIVFIVWPEACASFSSTSLSVLKDLYDSTNGKNWAWQPGAGKVWNFTENNPDPCVERWQGISCTPNNSTVEALNLPYYNLVGTLPTSIGSLAQMLVFNITHNFVNGQIPNEVEYLTNIFNFVVSYNNLDGTIIPGLAKLQNLTVLDLSWNKFTSGLTTDLLSLPKLTFIDVSFNLIGSTLPNIVNSNTPLKFINFQENELIGTVPTSWSKLQHLQFLYLGVNQLSGSNLQYVTSSWNNLKLFNVSFNSFTGQLDDINIPCDSMYYFIAANNQFEGTIGDTFDLSNRTLLSINLANNKLKGPLTDIAGTFPNLTTLDVSGNSITGSIPTYIFNFPKLTTLSVVKNCLVGPLPTSAICKHQSLQTLALDGMHTSTNCQRHYFALHEISSFKQTDLNIGNMKNLACLLNMTNLQTLHLSGNAITGFIPDIASPALQDLSLSYNQLTGSIPMSIQLKSNWKHLDLSFNKLKGVLEDSIPVPEVNMTLKLIVNRLSKHIPVNLLNIQQIEILQGNIFDCQTAQVDGGSSRGLPKNDDYTMNYTCGSDSVDIASSIWGFVFVILFLMFLTFHYWEKLKHYVQCCVYYNEIDEFRQEINRWFKSFYRNEKKKLRTKTIVPPSATNPSNDRQISNASNASTINGALAVPPLYAFAKGIDVIRIMIIMITAFALIVLMPVYSILGVFYSTHDYTYVWQISIAYRSGLAPTMILFAIMLVFFSFYASSLNANILLAIFKKGIFKIYREIVSFLAYSCCRMSVVVDTEDAMNEENMEQHTEFSLDPIYSSSTFMWFVRLFVNTHHRKEVQQKRFGIALRTIITIVNGVVVLSANIGYVYLRTMNIPQLAMFFTEFGLSVFKVMWSNVVILYVVVNMLNHFSSWEPGPRDNSEEEINRPMIRRVRFLSFLFICNNIILPYVAETLVDPNCFYYLFFPQHAVSVTYQRTFCADFAITEQIESTTDHTETVGLYCDERGAYQTTTQFDPPFVYSYQCSSALLNGFVIVFIYRYLITISYPVGEMIFYQLRHKQSGWIRWLENLWNSVTGFLEITGLSNKEKQEMQLESFVVTIIGDLAILLTFGLAFPPLAAIICCSMVGTTYVQKLFIGRGIYEVYRERKQRIMSAKRPSTATVMSHATNQLSTNVAKDGIEGIEDGDDSFRDSSFQLGERTTQDGTSPSMIGNAEDTIRASAIKEELPVLAANTYSNKQQPEPPKDSDFFIHNKFIKLFWPTIPTNIFLSSIFISTFLFDIYGDEVGVNKAFWVMIVLPSFPFFVWCVEYTIEEHKKKKEQVKHARSNSKILMKPDFAVDKNEVELGAVSPMHSSNKKPSARHIKDDDDNLL